jgi:hypothetical protein
LAGHGLATFVLGSMTGSIAQMDYPFRCELGVSSEPYQLIVDSLMVQK